MKRLLASTGFFAALFLASPAAQAQYQFDYGGRTIRIDPDRGTVSIPGVYVGFPDKIPMGAAMNKALTFRMGQTHVPKYHKLLLEKIQAGAIDPSFVITHRLPLEEGPAAYKTFRDKKDHCIKVVLKP